MAIVPLNKDDLPFLLGGKSEIAVDTGKLRPHSAVPEDATNILSVAFTGNGAQKVSLGGANSVKLGVSTSATASLTPVFSTSAGGGKLLKAAGIDDFFKRRDNSDKVVLVFDVGASGSGSAAGSFTYSALKTTLELDAGADAGYTYARALDKTLKIELLLPAFFKTMRLPEQGDRPPEAGEAIALRYGGYLKFSAEVAAGYQLTGTKDVSLGQLALSEKYDLSILGKIGLSAGVAGRYSILVTGDDSPGWARVQVRRHRAKDMKVAADVTVDFKNDLTDLPADAHEFLGAVLGTNAKNFLTVFDKALELSDFEKFTGAIDGLARKYVEEFTGKGFETLAAKTELQKFLARVNRIVTSYDTLEDRAVTLFDRYFDKLDDLTAFLDRIEGLTAGGLVALRKDLNPQRFAMLSQLTDGDPLGFLLEEVTVRGRRLDAIAELKKRAAAVRELIRGEAHQDISDAIGVAKRSFAADKLFRELAKIDTIAELQAVANDKAGLFVTRLVGRSLDSAPNLKQAFNEVHAVLARIDAFADRLFAAFKEAVNSSYKVALHSEYSRASENDSLIDVLINMAAPGGTGLLAQAGQGDFVEIIGIADTDRVRLREGTFTHRVRRDEAFRVNILGWHLDYRYEGFDRVVTETEQRLIPSDHGITILNTATLEVERERKRRGEAMHVDFLLRALGESANVVRSDERTREYLIETLSSLTARYQLNFTDEDTSMLELSDYLAFAKDLGLDARGASLGDLEPLLARAPNGGFGRIDAAYEIRFGRDAVTALLAVKSVSAAGEASIRNAMRHIVLSNYLKGETMHDVAFAYASPGVFSVFQAEGFATFQAAAQRVFAVQLSNPAILAPATVVLDRIERTVLSTLYHIENSMVNAIRNLYKLLNKGPISPAEFEDRLADFGSAMKDFDKFDQTTSAGGIGTSTIFVMFDQLVRLGAGGDSRSTAMLRLKAEANGKETEKVFLTEAAAAGR
jgi:hypothetical protein